MQRIGPTDHPPEVTLLDFLTGELPRAHSDSIRRHVASCPECRGTIDSLNEVVGEFDSLPTVAIPHDTLAPPPSPPAPRRGPGRAIALGLAGIVGISALFTFLNPRSTAPTSRRTFQVGASQASAPRFLETRLHVDHVVGAVPDSSTIIVLVRDADVARAAEELARLSDPGGKLTVQLAGSGERLTANGPVASQG